MNDVMGDDPRFRALFDVGYPLLAHYARRRGLNEDDADDLIASTFEVVLRRIEVVPEGDEAVLWLYGVAFNQLRNLRRSTRRRQRLQARLPVAMPEPAPAEPSELTAAVLAAALGALSDDDREVILLATGERLSAAEAGAVLGCGAVAFRSRLHRARNRLARLLAIDKGEQRPAFDGHERDESTETTEARE
jgi:RNA polymerase sigma-70 factor (ECF subfamily)